MKKIFASILLFAVSLAAFAKAVTPGEAEAFARNFMGVKKAEIAFTSLTDPKPMVKAASGTASAATFYAFNNPNGGWVILAADDCATPVLAHSDTGSISAADMPGNLRNYLRLVTNNISKASSAGMEAAPEHSALWAANGAGTKAGTGEVCLNTAPWDQGSPYNNTINANVKNGTTALSGLYTGCVATAMAEILAYHRYPAAPKGTVASYKTSSKKYTVPAVNLDAYGNYDWANIPKDRRPSTTAEKQAVADIMYHCGAMVTMDYTKEGSGAYSENIVPAMVKHLSYSSSAAEFFRANYSNSDWFNMIKDEIDAKRPILYGGSDEDTEDGHQFVCDGYNAKGEVHINWGWSGSGNGWFAVSYLGDKDRSGVNDVFNYFDSAIFGLQPDKEGDDPAYAEPYICSDMSASVPGIKLSSGTIAKDQTFTLAVKYIMNDASVAYNGKVKAALVNSDGEVREYIGEEKSLTISASSSSSGYTELKSYSCKITKDILPGDYIQFYYSEPSGAWHILGGWNLNSKDTQYQYFSVCRLSAFNGFSFIVLPSSLQAGNVLYLETVSDGRLQKSPITWYYDGNKETKGFVNLNAGKHTVKAKITYVDGSTQTLARTFEVK